MHVLVCADLGVGWACMCVCVWVVLVCSFMRVSLVTGVSTVSCTSSPLSVVSGVSQSVLLVSPQGTFVDGFSVAMPEMPTHSTLYVCFA